MSTLLQITHVLLVTILIFHRSQGSHNRYWITTEDPSTISPSEGVRLVGGSHFWEGRVEIYYNGTWGTVCDDDFDTNDAKVICVMLGYSRYGSITAYGNAHFGHGLGPILLDDLGCNGYEADIALCNNRGWYNNNCGHGEDAGVSCGYQTSTSSMTTEDVSYGQTGVRLVDGNYRWEGRVEVYHNGEWGTVCDDSFDRQDAQVICAMLGYSRYGSVSAYQNAQFGQGSGSIMLDDLHCNGHESDISQCSSGGWKTHNCGHREDAGVSCDYPKTYGEGVTGTISWYDQTSGTEVAYTLRRDISVRLTYGDSGFLEVYYRGRWGFVCYEYNLTPYQLNPVCRYLGYPSARYVYSRYESSPAILTDLTCSNNYYYYSNGIDHCSGRGLGSNHYCSNKLYIECETFSSEAPETTVPTMVSSGQTVVRLVGGYYRWEGRVEVYHNGEWGTICDDNFDRQDAQVICAMLGYYRYGSISAYNSATYGRGHGKIMLDDLGCSGYETDISQCRSNGWYNHDCSHSEDASVSCEYPSSYGSRSTTEETTTYEGTTESSYTLGSYYGHIPIRLSGGSRGYLEVYYRGRWGYVCYETLSAYQLHPVCRYLGYPSARYVYSRYSSSPAILTDLTCSYNYNYYSNGIDHCSGRDLGSNHYCNSKLNIECEGISTEAQETTMSSLGCQSVGYNPADLVFVIDESGSVQQDNFDRTKQSIVDTIRNLDVQNDVIRVGLMKFDDSYSDVFYLSSYIRQAYSMERQVMGMSYSGGGTDIARALNRACQFYFQSSYGGRSNAQNYIVLLTDGQSSAQQAADDCKARGIKIITVGIGTGIDEPALKRLAYSIDYYISTNYTEIVGFLPKLVTTAVSCGGLEKSDIQHINVNCQHSNWYIKVNVPPLEQKYSGFNDGDVYLGQHSCTGYRSGDYLIFNEDYAACRTTKETSPNGVIYKNTLTYAVHDPYQPFIVHEYRFQINVECDMAKIEGNENLIYNNHGVTQQAAAGIGHFPVELKFFSDKNYQNQFTGFPPSYMVGQNVYVSAQTPIHDYNVKMRLSECYTKPSKYASDKYTYYIIRNGCPAEPNAFVTSTRTHETRFHFQDFEYAFQPDTMYVHCNATFCHVNDYSSECEPRCHSKRVASGGAVDEASDVQNNEQNDGPIEYTEAEAVLYYQTGGKTGTNTGEKNPKSNDHGKPLYVVGAVVTGVAMLVILAGISMYFRSKRNRRAKARTV